MSDEDDEIIKVVTETETLQSHDEEFAKPAVTGKKKNAQKVVSSKGR